MIDNTYLLGLFGGTSSSSGFGASGAPVVKKRQPTAPWSTGAVVPQADERVRAALGGRRVVDEDAYALDATDASGDYKRLFALYQGLETLTALTNRASVKGISTSELALLQKRFGSGLSEIGTWLGGAEFQDVRMVQGTTAATSKTTTAVRRDSAVSITAPIHEGAADQVVAAFQGDVAFTIGVRKTVGATTTTTPIQIDLADMGATPRTLDAVLKHVNDALQAAGVETRLGREAIKAEPKTVTVNGKAVTLPAGPDRWALAVRGTPSETVSFSEAAPRDAVYVVQASGKGGLHEVLKFQSDQGGGAPATSARVGETQWVDGRVSQTALPEGYSAVRASAATSDGGLWLVADVDGAVADQAIKGASDVALVKLDSAGRVVSTRTLGAAGKANGYALSVAPDGRVAVAGSVVGALEPGKSGDVPTDADSFVTIFDAAGVEQWSQRRGARAADEATSVSFAADGTVVVAGRAKSAMTGGASLGGWDGYVQSFRATQPYPGAAFAAAPVGVAQFGTSAEDSVSASVAVGQDVFTTGVEDGRLIVRKWTLDAAGKPALAARRDLGVAGGQPAGIAVEGGRVVVSGTTHNAALDAGTPLNAHSGGTDAYLLTMGSDLAPGTNDRLTYFGGSGNDDVADVKVHDGKVWITGVSDRPADAKAEAPTRGYLARLDALTGVVEWTRDWAGEGDQARPATLAVAAGAAGVLDRLGLPRGDVVQSDSKRLVEATSLRPGDRFYVSPPGGGRTVAVTIDARDTLQTLARKIEGAALGRLKVTVASDAAKADGAPGLDATFAGLQRLSIMARDGREGAVFTAGEPGRDALAGLGLSAGFVGPTAQEGEAKTFGLNLPRTLSLGDADAVKAAGERLQAAMKAVRDAYRALNPTTTTSSSSGAVPAYLSNQLANYQAALARLGG
ncbi:MAG TPA: transcriptional regulator [Brevundimonas sp.]|jgi:hypothetical protein|uniref:transcriptional regulator n=1 Tax=Brevundimonas sp. TaxID=1871086 RepID=UPI002DE6CD7B|nr:transcriptional regulator [Brevundimonas sp.]